MPTYEYACRDCGEHIEVVQSFKDDALTTCGFCDGRLRKVFSAAGIIFKGDGYYVTDTRKKDKAASGKAGTETKPAASGGKAADSGKAADGSSSSATASSSEGSSSGSSSGDGKSKTVAESA